MLHKTRESTTTNPPPVVPTEPEVEERVAPRIQDHAVLLVGDPTILTDDQEKALADYAVRAGMTIEQARAELLALPRRPIVVPTK